MKYLLVTSYTLLAISQNLVTSISNSFAEKFSALGYSDSLSSVGEKFWMSKDENNSPLVELNNWKFPEWKEYLGIVHEKLSKKLPELSENFEIIQMKIDYIDFFYEKFYTCANATNICKPESTPAKMASAFLSGHRTAANLVHKIMEPFVLGQKSIIHYFDHNKFEKTCSHEDEGHSMQQFIDNYRKMIQISGIKVFLAYRIAALIAQTQGINFSGNLTEILTKNLEALDAEYAVMIRRFKDRTKFISRDVWKCNPIDGFKEDVSYIKLKRVFQGFINSQYNIMKKRYPKEICPNEEHFCGGVNPTTERPCKGKNSICQVQDNCAGYDNLWECEKRFYNDGILGEVLGGSLGYGEQELKICPAQQSSERRYDFAYVNDFYYVKNDTCNRTMVIETNAQRVGGTCFACYCICDDQNSKLSERTLSLLIVESDYWNNYVVTGARLRKQFGVIYIQIQQGLLLPNGTVNSSSVHWKEVPDVGKLDPSHKIHLNWNETRSIQLEDIDLPFGNILVGLKFDTASSGKVRRLRIMAVGVSFDFNTGMVNDNGSLFSWGESVDFSKKSLGVHEFLLPSNNSNDFVVTNTSVSFDISDLKTDLGQTTIPFIDIQDVTTKIPTIIGGAGTYYKYPGNNSKEAGYIGLKLKTYDFAPHINFN